MRAFVITIQDHVESNQAADKCIESHFRLHSSTLLPDFFTIEKFNAVKPEEIYEIYYYQKSSREALRSFAYSDSVDWITLKEGDTTIQRQNKNSVSKTYVDLAKEADQRLNNLLYQYNYQKASPLQVAGVDGTLNLSGKLV